MIYDLIVIGGGPAGYLACERAHTEGFKTLLIEERFIGGVCLNEGCIPSKTLLNSAKIYDYARYSEKYGVTASDVQFDHTKVVKRKNKVVRTLVGGIKAKLKAAKVTIVEGSGKITGRNESSYSVAAGDSTYQGKRLLIATGSSPIIPPLTGIEKGFDSGFVVTNREIFELETIPESLVVIGGGIVGLEMASYFNSVGSKVTVVEMLDHIAGDTDLDISTILLNNYQKKGIEFKLNSKVKELQDNLVIYEHDGQEASLKADKVLMSVGRRPNIEAIGLDSINVEIEKNAIKVDEYGQTNIPGVYAAGDVNGKSMLAHTAYREAEVCINHMSGKRDLMRYNAIPAVIYTNPEVASLGETEASAKAKGLDFSMANLSMRYSGRYVAENEGGNGICKVLVDNKYHHLIGVHMIGNYASEIIYGAAVMMETEMQIKDIKEIVFPHPTVSEILREAIFEL